MASIPQTLAIAIQHHNAGRLPAAEEIYRQILAVAPEHAEALHLLGVLAHQSRQHEAAVEYIERAIRQKGDVARFHNNLGGSVSNERNGSELFAGRDCTDPFLRS
jgi:protein O-GlcNAc transferase